MQFQPGQEPSNKLSIPERELLESLYLQQGLTAQQIAELLSVSRGTIYNWLNHYSIPRRPSGIGLITKGKKPPTKVQLNRMIHEQGMTYQEVADRYGVDFTAVPYWLEKYDLSRPQQITFAEQHAGPESQQVIRSMYESGLSLQQIGEHYGVSRTPIEQYLRQLGVEIRPAGWTGDKRFECKDGDQVRSTYERQVDDWLYQHSVEHIYEPQLPFALNHNADFLANGWYIEVWGVDHNEAYEQRKTHKLELYQLHNIPLIEIPGHAFTPAYKGLWKRRLRQCLSTPKDRI